MTEAPEWKTRIAEIRAERDAQVIELRQAGATRDEIAAELGVSAGLISKILTGHDAEDDAASTALAGALATPARAPVPIERLRSGSLPDSAPAADEVDAGRLADRILRRPF